jgi:chemotaxis methyl-accepting protein methylase
MSLGELLSNLQRKFGKDFSNYRVSCLQRRVSLRMSVLGIAALEEYMAYLSANPGEIEELLDTVTIHVTEFFRDKDVFDAVGKNVLPAIIERKLHSPSRTIRIWSAGCSTGEESYSIAILSLEYMRLNAVDLAVEVYGTDISKEACATAGAGVYPEHKVERLSATLRRRYFEASGDAYRVVPELKRRVKFTVHDLFSAAPYRDLDFVVCRNVLIHFDNTARDAVLRQFHASLGDHGILILGRSEAIMGAALELFELVDPRSKVYRKIVTATPKGGSR